MESVPNARVTPHWPELSRIEPERSARSHLSQSIGCQQTHTHTQTQTHTLSISPHGCVRITSPTRKQLTKGGRAGSRRFKMLPSITADLSARLFLWSIVVVVVVLLQLHTRPASADNDDEDDAYDPLMDGLYSDGEHSLPNLWSAAMSGSYHILYQLEMTGATQASTTGGRAAWGLAKTRPLRSLF